MTCLHITTKPTKANLDPNGGNRQFSTLNHGELQTKGSRWIEYSPGGFYVVYWYIITMENGRGWDFYLFLVFGSVGFLALVITFVRWLWKRFHKPASSFTLPPIPLGVDPQEFVAKLHGLADYVDGLLTVPEKQKRNLFKKARTEQEKHHHSTAIDLFRNCLSLQPSAKEKAVLHLQIGNSYLRLGEPGHALAAYQLALSAARQCGEIEAEGAALGNMGLVYAAKGELDKALTHHQQSLDIHRKIGNPLGEANALGNMGIVYADKGELDKALTHYQQSLDINRKIGNPLGEASALGNMGRVYHRKGKLDKALTHYQQALDIHRKIGNPLGEANDLGNMGFVLTQKEMVSKARDCFRASYKIYLKLGASPGSLSKVKKALDELGEG